MLELYRTALAQSKDFALLASSVRDGVTPISVFGVSDGQKAHIAAALQEGRSILYLASGAASAEKVRQDLAFYTGETVILFPQKEYLLGAQFHNREQEQKRIAALDRILKGGRIVVAPLEAVLYNMMPPDALRVLRLEMRVGGSYDRKELSTHLLQCGYQSVSGINGHGEFFLHGGILDIFPPDSEFAVRIDFFDDEVETIRLVDPVSQRSGERLDRFEILPLQEVCASDEVRQKASAMLEAELLRFNKTCKNRETVTAATDTFATMAEKLRHGIYPSNSEELLPYFYPSFSFLTDYMPQNTVIFFDEPRVMQERSQTLEEEFSKAVTDCMAEGRALPRHANAFGGFERFWKQCGTFPCVALQTLSGALPFDDAQALFRFDGRTMQAFHGKPEFLLQEVKLYRNADYRVILCAGTEARAERLEKEFTEAGIGVIPLKRTNTAIEQGQIAIVTGTPVRGFEYPLLKLAVIAENDIFAVSRVSGRAQKQSHSGSMDTFVQLNVGDAVVHENNGIGIYQGIVQIETDGVKRDYLAIRFRGEDKLYVPVEQMNRVQKYIAPGDAQPVLSKLGTQEWNKTKARVRSAIADMTDKLLALYRAREAAVGYCFDKDTPWQREFEDDFPYEETPDQVRCIREIKADMESPRAMDRLLCGDVGYGKTEVALRAVFKAVMSGKQAAILAPTTILAQQHYHTLKARLVNFQAVRVDMLSRFRSPSEQKRTLSDLAAGKVDIVVGTHRLLAKDVVFKDLGLLVVDEEQRFGVAHKEKIKQLKNNIDVLTLSATPIPRTLNMALSGIRDMSLLETPPQERYPVQTFVIDYSDSVVRDAILRELERGGQVYYLFNRVQGIEMQAERLRELVPQARIAVGHGQMDEKALEQIVLDFYNGEYDVLLCTTIIENGVDIPGANTIIVQDAHRLGLAQLYQLRGRVGRSNRMAYAYFTVPPARSIGEDAVKRLQAIEEFTQMGSGFRIAMRDLEIRGAGNLLGGEQHGHMNKIGYDLYCKMIKEAVAESLGNKQEEKKKASVEMKLDAYISQIYVPDETVRFSFYRRISDIGSAEDADNLRDELKERFGPLPEAVENLLTAAYLRSLAGENGVGAIKEQKGMVMLSFTEPDLQRIAGAVEKFSYRCVLSPGNTVAVLFRDKAQNEKEKLQWVREFLEFMATES